MQDIHREYGDMVRVGPNEMSFCTIEAHRDIYCHYTAGKNKLLKTQAMDSEAYPRITSVKNPEGHAAQRKALSHAFSAKALRFQEDLVHRYVDLWLSQLYKLGNGGEKPVNITDAFDWLTFDIIGDLCFAEPFGAVEECSGYWISVMLDAVLVNNMVERMNEQPWLKWVIPRVWGAKWDTMVANRELHWAKSKDKARRRMEKGALEGRDDFFNHMIKRKQITDARSLEGNGQTLIVAGSETTTTALTGTVWYLLANPSCLEQLKQEIRGAFKTREEITGDSTAKLEYLRAVIEEGLRLFPPIVHRLQRDNPETPYTIDGHHFAAGTLVASENYTMARDPRYWVDPDEFRPERWLGDGLEGDDRRAHVPFSAGPRYCIGVNLAYLELRVILSKLVYTYDLELASTDIKEWNDACKCFGLWKKPALLVKLQPRANKEEEVASLL